MKKFLVLLTLFAVTTCSFAQVAFGVKGGYKTSLGMDENWDAVQSLGESFNKDVSQGFNVGLMSRFGYRVYAQIEALYSYQSTTYSDGVSAPETLIEHGIEVPVMFGAKLIETRLFNLRLMAGPTFCFNLGEDGQFVGSWSADRRTVAFGLDCGLGVDIWVFAIDFRYKLVQPTYKYHLNDITLNTSPVNAFEVSLGIKFFDHTNRRR